MKVGLSAGYWGAGPPVGVAQQLEEAEALGVDSFWTAEAYGSDALTPLAWWGARTSSIGLGTSICQLSARTPTALAMAAMTLDHLSQGRVLLGIGASGPQVVEGWYGQPYPRPLERTREYVEILRAVVARDAPVTYDGAQYQLPARSGTGLGKPLRSTIHPYRPSIPIFLGAEGPKNVALAAEIADGWLALWYSPRSDAFYREALAAGFDRPGARTTASTFDAAATVMLVEHDDVEVAASFLKPVLALYIGGMGARDANFHHDVFVRMGWGTPVRRSSPPTSVATATPRRRSCRPDSWRTSRSSAPPTRSWRRSSASGARRASRRSSSAAGRGPRRELGSSTRCAAEARR